MLGKASFLEVADWKRDGWTICNYIFNECQNLDHEADLLFMSIQIFPFI